MRAVAASGPGGVRASTVVEDSGWLPVERHPVPPPAPGGQPAPMAALCAGPAVGVVYLLHFDRPYRHARHYQGWPQDLDARLWAHTAGHGACLIQVVMVAGIGFTLARTWLGTRTRERQLKRQGGASRRCPLCGVNPRMQPGSVRGAERAAAVGGGW